MGKKKEALVEIPQPLMRKVVTEQFFFADSDRSIYTTIYTTKPLTFVVVNHIFFTFLKNEKTLEA